MNRLLSILLITILQISYLLWWEGHTQAVLDVDAPEQLEFPVSQALELYRNGFGFQQIMEMTVYGPYPKGFLIYLYLCLLLGMSKLITGSLYWLCFPALLLFNSILLFDQRKQLLSYSLLIFFFPVYQLLLKSLSLHSLLILLQISGVLALLKGHHYRANHLKLSGWLLLGFGASFKHLGLIHWLLIIPFFLGFQRRTLSLPASTAIILCFYSETDYLRGTFDHNPLIEAVFPVLMILVTGILILSIRFLLNRDFAIREVHPFGPWIGLVGSLFAYDLFLKIDDISHQFNQIHVPVLMMCLWLIPLFLWRKKMDAIHQYLILILSVATLLFFSSLGFLHSIFWFPILILLILASRRILYHPVLFSAHLSICLVWSHFYPDYLSKGFQSEAFREKNILLMNNSHQNYWSLDPCALKKLKDVIQSISKMSDLEFSREYAALVARIDQYQSFVLNAKSPTKGGTEQVILNVNSQIPFEFWESWQARVAEVGLESALDETLENGLVKVLAIPKLNYARFQQSLYPEDSVKYEEVKRRFEVNDLEIHHAFYYQNFADLACAYLRSKPSLQGKYRRIEINSSNFELWIYKK